MYVGFVVVFDVFCCFVAAAVALTLGCLSRNENLSHAQHWLLAQRVDR